MAVANREYRDRLFKFIFGNPDNRAWTLSLYNAVNGSDYTDASQIRYTTIEDAVYMNMKNDVSLLVADTMSFYEQQSTFNPNMPMRFLIYAGMVYAKYIEQTDSYHPYSSQQQKAPAPKCVCFYNGMAECEDKVTLSLKDAFEGDGDIDVRVTMLNINCGRNKVLMDACQPLREYAWFVSEVRDKQVRMNELEAAVDAALEEMPEDCILKPFLLSHRAEVKRMCITEYNEVKTLADERQEGLVRGTVLTLTRLMKKGLLTEAEAAEEANMSVEEFREKAALVSM